MKTFMASFDVGNNHEHRHTEIGHNTPADVCYGLAAVAAKAGERAATLDTAREFFPKWCSTKQAPQILCVPETAWINKPADKPLRMNGPDLACLLTASPR